MKLIMGGGYDSIYWNAGIISFFTKNDIDIEIISTGVSSVLSIYKSIYGKFFFNSFKTFIDDKNNPINKIISQFSDKAITSSFLNLLKFGTSKSEFFNTQELQEYIFNNFGNSKLKDINPNLKIEAYSLNYGRFFYFNPGMKISDIIITELAITPFFRYHKINNVNLVPSSVLCEIPFKEITESKEKHIVPLFFKKKEKPMPSNGLNILLDCSEVRRKNLAEKISKDNFIAVPENYPQNPYTMSAFFEGYNNIEKLWGKIND